MSKIHETLDRILDHLQQLKRPVVSRLQQGLSRKQIIKNASNVKLRLPDSAIDLLGWRNGTDLSAGKTLGELSFFPGYYLMSVEEAVSDYASLSRNTLWDKSWFPLFCSGGGDFYAIVCNQDHATDGAIVDYFRDDFDHEIEYVSLTAMLATIEACYQSGAFYTDTDGYLSVNDAQRRSIAAIMNQR
jgi:hypothetical protein